MRISDWSSDVCSSDLVTLAQVARAAQQDASLPDDLKGPLEGQHHLVAGTQTYPNGCHLCELEVDPDTGSVKLLRYVVVDDFGVVVNPLLVGGQVHGGDRKSTRLNSSH